MSGDRTTSDAAGWPRLALATGALALVWLVVLPWVARRPAVARHIRAMEEAEVHPAAMVYTELERLPTRAAWVERHLVLWP